jgi:FkbM family methyltransferase
MVASLKRLIGESPLGPLARRIYRRCFPRKPVAIDDKNAEYDRQTVEVMRRVLQPDSCCVDLGAHGGSILREMLRISPQGTHFAFEPLPELAENLRREFPTVRVHELAVSDYTGTASFVHVVNDPAYSGLRKRVYDRPDPVLKPITVNVVKLDDVIPTAQRVAFIKLDIEGGSSTPCWAVSVRSAVLVL